MSIMIKNNITHTYGSIEFFMRYKEAFGKIVKAEMISRPENVDYKLILTNSNKEELVFDGGLTSGYIGEGSRGTQKVLGLAGFTVTDEFIINHPSFVLTR